MKLATGLVIAGRYRLERRLAIGGMGSLWVARHAQLDVDVAIKFIDPKQAGSPVARQRFEREAKASATLRNAHVVHVQDYGIDGDLPYLVMELLHGEDLGRRLEREKRLSLPAIARILHQAAKGLRRAHEAGVVHRDLKPANIFMARTDDEDEVVKILDFGIAKETGAVLVGEGTKTGELMGSPHYMSPEQVRGAKDLDHRSDLWSLGVILFRASSGKLPFASQVLGAVIAHILADPIPRLTEVAPDLPPQLDPFFAKAFARDKTQRFQTAKEMSEAFTAIVQVVMGGTAPRLDSLHESSVSSPTWTPPPIASARPGATPARPPTPPSAPRPPMPPVPPRPPTPPSIAPKGLPSATPVAIPAPAPVAKIDAIATIASTGAATPPPLPKPSAPSDPGPDAAVAAGIDITFDPVAEPEKPVVAATLETPPSSSGLTPTGGPLVHTPLPSWAPRAPSSTRWAVGISVGLGLGFIVLFLSMRGGGSATSTDDPTSSPGAEHASARVEATALPASAPVVESPAIAASAAPSASASAPPRADPPRPTTPTTPTATPARTTDPSARKKKPSWGF